MPQISETYSSIELFSGGWTFNKGTKTGISGWQLAPSFQPWSHNRKVLWASQISGYGVNNTRIRHRRGNKKKSSDLPTTICPMEQFPCRVDHDLGLLLGWAISGEMICVLDDLPSRNISLWSGCRPGNQYRRIPSFRRASWASTTFCKSLLHGSLGKWQSIYIPSYKLLKIYRRKMFCFKSLSRSSATHATGIFPLGPFAQSTRHTSRCLDRLSVLFEASPQSGQMK